SARSWRVLPGPASVLVAVPVVFALGADFAAREARGMGVHVGRPCADGPDQLIELAGAQPLSSRPRADACGPDRPADRSAGRRAPSGWTPRRQRARGSRAWRVATSYPAPPAAGAGSVLGNPLAGSTSTAGFSSRI